MNYSIIIYLLSWVLRFQAAFLTLPCIVAIIYKEEEGYTFLFTLILCLLLGEIGRRFGKKNKNTTFYAKEGFVTVALSWIILAVTGAIPMFLSKDIPNFVNALFESVSGFTTTGSSILTDVEAISQSSIIWRSFTHWIGGMGVLVFILAVLPLTGGQNMHLIKAESPGPQVGKLVPRVRSTAKILYAIYVALTITQIVFLLAGGMSVFDTLNTAFATAGTGGFGFKNDGFAGYSVYLQGVTAVFMVLFGVNFNVYYLLLIHKFRQVIKAEEAKVYLCIVMLATIFITFNIKDLFESTFTAFHNAFFHVASIITTTGFAISDFNLWPMASKVVLILLMFTGACAGSTAGGIKVSRIVLAFKMIKKEISTFIHPRSIKSIRFEQKAMDNTILYSVAIFFLTYLGIFAVSFFIIALDQFDFTTSFTSVAATINNVGPGLEAVGPMGNFASFSILSKFVLIFDMLVGRLELFPMLILFAPKTWRR